MFKVTTELNRSNLNQDIIWRGTSVLQKTMLVLVEFVGEARLFKYLTSLIYKFDNTLAVMSDLR